MGKLKKKSMHVQIGDALLASLHIKLYNTDLYVYHNGFYIKDTSIIEREILSLNENTTKTMRQEILEYLKIKLSGENITVDKKFINFKNCLCDVENQKILQHTPSIFSINQINADYIDSKYIDSNIETFLDEITSYNSARKKTILQIIGYSMTSSIDFQKAFIFYGESAENGKSTLLDVISHLIGEDNISHITIHNLQHGKYYSAELKNKLLNTVAELPRTKLDSVETFKSVVTGDSIAAEEKYKDRYTIKPYAKHIFTSNELPLIDDKTNGFYRRLNIVNFDAKFSLEQKKSFDINKLLTSRALNYLARISIDAYIELLNSMHFANEEESNRLIEDYKKGENNTSLYSYLYSNVFNDFIKNYINFKVPKELLYENYLKYCHLNNYNSILGRNIFYDKIIKSNMFSEVTINGLRYFKFLN